MALIKLKSTELQPGMFVGDTVFDENNLVILHKGLQLTEKTINLVMRRRVKSVVVEMDDLPEGSLPAGQDAAAAVQDAPSAAAPTQPPPPSEATAAAAPAGALAAESIAVQPPPGALVGASLADLPLPATTQKRPCGPVLVVDDEPDIVAYLAALLSSRGYPVLTSPSGRAALETIGQYRSQLSVILLDITMPEMDGFQIAREIQHRLGPEAPPVIFVTARRTLKDVLAARELQTHGYLTKPFDPDKLIATIERCLTPARA